MSARISPTNSEEYEASQKSGTGFLGMPSSKPNTEDLLSAEEIHALQQDITAEPVPRSVDEFIDDDYGENCYARWCLNHMRLPASLKCDFDQFMEPHVLFCTYEGNRYRVNVASTLGDIGITANPYRKHSYDKRVLIDDCSEWSSTFRLPTPKEIR